VSKFREDMNARRGEVDIVFFREGYFYIAPYPKDYSDWVAEAKRNPGTIRIEDVRGKVLWPALKLAEGTP